MSAPMLTAGRGRDGVDEIEDLRAALHRDPRRVAERASALLVATALGDTAPRSRLLALRGRARRSLGEMELAELDLRAAIDAAIESATAAAGPTSDELAADAHLGLAGVLAWAGRTSEAFEHLDRAERLGNERTVAYAALQRASVAQRTGRHDLALAAYEAALPALVRLDLRTDQALVHMNRSMIRAAGDDLPGAFADLARAEALFAAEGNDFGVAQVRHGIGVARLRAGDLPGALEALDAAAERFGALGHDALDVAVDRVEALLAAGLAADAAADAADLARRFEEAGSHSLAAEAWLRSAQAARLDGDVAGALDHARRAQATFARQHAVGWERLARLEVERSAVDRGATPASELRDLARELAGIGDAAGAAGALALACRVALGTGELGTAQAAAVECENRAARIGMLDVRLAAAHASAAVAAARGDRASARRHLRRGLDERARHRATLGAGEARAAIAGHADDLVRLGLRLAAADASAASLYEWSERARAGRHHQAPVRPPADAALAADLAALRRVAADVRARLGEDGDIADLLAERRRLERAVQRRHLHLAGTAVGSARVAPLGAVLAALDEGCLVSLVEVDGRLLAVTLAAGRAVRHDLGPAAAVSDAAAAVAAGLRALADPALVGPRRAARVRALTAALAVVGNAVAPAMAGEGPVRLVLPGALHAVPWAAVPGLVGRPVTVVPSAGWWLEVTGRTGPVRAGGDLRALVVAGPRLDHADAEARVVAARHSGATVLAGVDATGPAVLAALATADVAHLVAHGRLRHDSPSWSSLELADGSLCLHELERAERTSPVVVLSACDSGLGVRAGDQLVGLSSCFLGLGTRALVASVCRLPDTPITVALMGELHARLAAGTPVAEALAALDRGEPGSDRWVHAACLAAFGAG